MDIAPNDWVSRYAWYGRFYQRFSLPALWLLRILFSAITVHYIDGKKLESIVIDLGLVDKEDHSAKSLESTVQAALKR